MLLTTKPRGGPESTAGGAESMPVYPSRPQRAGETSRRERERGPSASAREHRPKASKMARLPETHHKKERMKKERAETEEVRVEEVKGGTVKCTVVDVDSVREKEPGEEEEEESLVLLETNQHEEGVKHRDLGVCEWLVMVLALTLVLLFLPLAIWFCVKVVREHERAVIFRLGHLLRGRPRGPGLLFYLPVLDVCQKVDIRLKMLQVPSHTVVTRDLVRTELSAVCYYRIENVALCGASLSSLTAMLQTLVQGAVRDVLAHHDFTHILLHRKRIGQDIQVAADSIAGQWGVRVERADIEELCLPVEVQQSLAAQADAKRQAQLKVIAAEGEKAACEALQASLHSLSSSPAAIQLRLLQLLHTLGTERPALVLTLPSDLLSLSPDLSPLPPPPPPATVGEEVMEEEPLRDSPMM
ncbi:podocin [Polymixia lowei]